MTKEELFKMMNENPVMHLATVDENGFPRVRGILMFKACEDGIIFHTELLRTFTSSLCQTQMLKFVFSAKVHRSACLENLSLTKATNFLRKSTITLRVPLLRTGESQRKKLRAF